jgi:amino acid transporter
MDDKPTLKRSLSLPLLTLYGLGTTLGAGIYVLIGKVAGVAGMHAALAFLVAGALAAFSAFSFAELGSRFPRSAGEAVYVHEGLGSRYLAAGTGLLVVLAGIVSSATIANGFVGYLENFFDTPDALTITLFVLALGVIAAFGILESVTFATVLTLIEMAGLLLIIWVARDGFATLPARADELVPALDAAAWLGVFAGGVLAFYAFIGFEDMVNVAEEVKSATRTLPRAIVLTLILTLVLYLAVALAAVFALPIEELAESDAPLSLVYTRATGGSAEVITVISLVAVMNGALIQIIMGARVLYGLSAMGWLPAPLSTVNRRTRTPLFATALVTGCVLAFALALPLVRLAQTTSLITLIIFAVVNVALARIKLKTGVGKAPFTVPLWVPLAGAVVSVGFAALQVAIWLGE